MKTRTAALVIGGLTGVIVLQAKKAGEICLKTAAKLDPEFVPPQTTVERFEFGNTFVKKYLDS